MRQSIPEEDLLEELRGLAWKLRRHPTTADMREYGAYSAQTYQDRFGSWTDALEAAGIADLTEPALDTDELLDVLVAVTAPNTPTDKLAVADRTPPTHQAVRDHSPYSPWLYIDRFESWLDALETAGFDVAARTDPAQVTATEDDLVVALHEIVTALNRTPTATEMDTYGDFHSQVYTARYGSWEAAIETAELPLPEASRQTVYSEADLLDHLQALAADLGRTPTSEDMYEVGEYAPLTYQYRFGSWNTAIEAAGLEPNTPADSKLSDEELTAELQALAKELEKTPSRVEMNAHGAYSATTYETHFGSWNDAVRAAGLPPNSDHHT